MDENSIVNADDGWDLEISGDDITEDEPAAEQEDRQEEAQDEAPGASEADQQEEAKEETPAEPGTTQEQKEEADQLFRLKHLDEERDYSREQVITLAQKGLDYDRIRARADELKSFVEFLAKQSGQTAEELMESTRATQLARDKGISLDEAKGQLRLQRREQELDAREQALKTREAGDSERERRQKDFLAFFRTHGEVKAESIPAEVWDKVRRGESLTTAWTAYENAQLKAQLEAEKQNRKNAQRAAGSASSAGKAVKEDIWMTGWDDT